MKLIVIILAIVVSVSAQEMKACVFFNYTDPELMKAEASMYFTQASPNVPILLKRGTINLYPGRHIIAVHDAYDAEKGCNFIGPIKEVRPGVLFYFIDVIVDENGLPYKLSAPTESTLVPNQRHSIVGSWMAIHAISAFDHFAGMFDVPTVACGLVVDGLPCEFPSSA